MNPDHFTAAWLLIVVAIIALLVLLRPGRGREHRTWHPWYWEPSEDSDFEREIQPEHRESAALLQAVRRGADAAIAQAHPAWTAKRGGQLLTELADYDEPGSWGRASAGWPEIRGDVAYAMYVFANCIQSVPYGSYVLIAQRGRYGASDSVLRVHAGYVEQLKNDFKRAGEPDVETSITLREKYGKPNRHGNKEAAPLWVAAAAKKS